MGEGEGHLPAEAASGACDDGDFAVEAEGIEHVSLPASQRVNP